MHGSQRRTKPNQSNIIIIVIIDANELNVRAHCASAKCTQSAKFYLLFFTFFQFSNSLFFHHFTTSRLRGPSARCSLAMCAHIKFQYEKTKNEAKKNACETCNVHHGYFALAACTHTQHFSSSGVQLMRASRWRVSVVAEKMRRKKKVPSQKRKKKYDLFSVSVFFSVFRRVAFTMCNLFRLLFQR